MTPWWTFRPAFALRRWISRISASGGPKPPSCVSSLASDAMSAVSSMLRRPPMLGSTYGESWYPGSLSMGEPGGIARRCASSRLSEARSLASSSDSDVGDPVDDLTLLTYRSPFFPFFPFFPPSSSRTTRPSLVSANLTLGLGGAVSAYLRPDPDGALRPCGVTRLGPSFRGVVAGCGVGVIDGWCWCWCWCWW